MPRNRDGYLVEPDAYNQALGARLARYDGQVDNVRLNVGALFDEVLATGALNAQQQSIVNELRPGADGWAAELRLDYRLTPSDSLWYTAPFVAYRHIEADVDGYREEGSAVNALVGRERRA